MSAEPTTTWFPVTSGRVSGVTGLVAAAVIVVLTVVDGADAVLLVVGLLLALLSWMVLLRPRVGVRGTDLVLRGVASTLAIPLASVGRIAARQVLAVRVGEKRYVSAAVGQSFGVVNRERRLLRRDIEPTGATRGPVDHVVELIESHVAEARREGAPAGAVRRRWAWPELAGLAVLVVALLVTALL